MVKALTPKARPFRDHQVRGLRDCANREGIIRSSLLHRIPVPLPVVRTPPLRSLDAHRWGPRSPRNGHSRPQWRPLRPRTHSLGARRRCAPPPTRARRAPRIRPLPGEPREPRYCRQVKSIQEQIHPTKTTQAFYQL